MEKERELFNEQYRFRGKHAYMVIQLRHVFEERKKTTVMYRNLDIMLNAPLVGFLFNRKAALDNQKDPQTGKVYDQSVMDKQVLDIRQDLIFNMRMILLLDKEYEPDSLKRIDKALRYFGQNEADYERFQEYMRGGIEVMYEKLCEDAMTPDDYLNNLFDFVTDVKERFNDPVDKEHLLDITRSK